MKLGTPNASETAHGADRAQVDRQTGDRGTLEQASYDGDFDQRCAGAAPAAHRGIVRIDHPVLMDSKLLIVAADMDGCSQAYCFRIPLTMVDQALSFSTSVASGPMNLMKTMPLGPSIIAPRMP